LEVHLLCRSRLAGDGIAVHPCPLARPTLLLDHPPEERRHRACGALTHYPPDYHGLVLLYHSPLRRNDAADDVGAHPKAPVCEGAEGDRHLQRRDRDALSEAVRGEVDAAPRRHRSHDPGALAGQLDAGPRAEAEGLQVAVVALGAEPFGHLARTDVAG